MSHVHDIVVVGGGPAGAFAAVKLAAAGRSVLLLERTAGPHHKVCGEFLSAEGVSCLQGIGMDLARLGAVPISTIGLIRGNRATSARLPFPALSLSRHPLDEALLASASNAGAEVRRNCRVRSIRKQGDRWIIEGDMTAVAGRDVFLATGKHDVHGWKRPTGGQDDLIGFKQQLRLAPSQADALTGRIDLYLIAGGYCGVEPVGGGICNVSLVIRKGRFTELGSWNALWKDMISSSPIFAECMEGAVPIFERPLAIGSIPYGLVRRESEGVWYLGDQAAVIPSFSGNGISMALHSADLAARHHVAGRRANDFQAAFARDVRLRVRGATLLSRLLVTTRVQGILSAAALNMPWILPAIAAGTRLPARD